MTQMSIGGSLQATTEYFVGTLGGAISPARNRLARSPSTTTGLAGFLARIIAPLALLAAVKCQLPRCAVRCRDRASSFERAWGSSDRVGVLSLA